MSFIVTMSNCEVSSLSRTWLPWRIHALLIVVLSIFPGRELIADPHAPAAGPASSESFLAFDAINLKGKPDLKQWGMKPIELVYGHEMWPAKPSDPDAADRLYAEVYDRGVVLRARRMGTSLACLDIEHWPVSGVSDAIRDESIAKYLRVLHIVRNERPGVRVGFYGLLPIRDYWRAVSPDADKQREWHNENAALTRLAREVDVIFPSIYTFYNDREGWVRYARTNIAEARRYGKAVYPFIMPFYHESNADLGEQEIDGEFWMMQLELCRELADGVVIWTTPFRQWNLDAQWAIRTQQFMEDLRSGTQSTPADGRNITAPLPVP